LVYLLPPIGSTDQNIFLKLQTSPANFRVTLVGIRLDSASVYLISRLPRFDRFDLIRRFYY